MIEVSSKTEKFPKSGNCVTFSMANLTGLANLQNMEVLLQAMNGDTLHAFGSIASHDIDESPLSLILRDSAGAKSELCLQELTRLGLVSKIGTKYTPTYLGNRAFRNQIEALEHTLVKKSNDLLLSFEPEVSKASDFQVSGAPDQDILEILRGAAGLPELKPVQIFHNWLDLSMQTAIAVGSMKEELHLATRYMDFRTAEIAVIAAKHGRRINILHGTRNGLSSKLQLLGNLMANPRAIKAYKEMTKNPNVLIRKSEIPYSFMIVDREKVGIEIVNPRDPNSFFLGFQFESRNFAAKLIWYFDEMLRVSLDDELKRNLESTDSAGE